MTDALDAARGYLARGFTPVPVPRGGKRPVLKGWQQLRHTEDDLPALFAGESNIGLNLGEPSGHLVDVDLDCDEAIELADEYLPPTPAVTGRAGKPRSHRWYVAEGAATRQFRDRDKSMIVELRSTGGQTLVGPSIHPESGEQYESLEGEPAVVPAAMLLACVEALATEVRRRRHGDEPTPTATSEPSIHVATNHTFDSSPDVERRAIAYLAQCPPAIEGQAGHDTTFAVTTALVHGFGLEPKRALDILLTEYNPRCDPEWEIHELVHKVESAASTPHSRPFGWLRDSGTSMHTTVDAGVDLSGILDGCSAASDEVPGNEPADPGPTPEDLLFVPGFVDEVVEYTLANAPYPDRPLAFAGALALQALLAGRRVRDSADGRSNLYVVALANSGAGKDFPRKVNERILLHAGLAESLGDEIGSAEGMLDDLEDTPSLLFQTDEIDFLMQAMNQPKESRYQRIMQALLKLFTSANGLYVKRKKVNKQRGYIDQPCVCLFGTAIPAIFYESLSPKMLTNGWFARLLVLESARRSEGRDDPQVAELPDSILETARWWSEFQPGRNGNLKEYHPEPLLVDAAPAANSRFREFRREANAEYALGEEQDDQACMAIWARAVEKARKLALLYAASESHESPLITGEAADWGCRLARHQTQRMLFMASLHVSDGDFEAKCKRVLDVLHQWRERHGDAWMPFRDVSRRLRWSKREHDDVRDTLLEQELIEYGTEKTAGRPRRAYRLLAEEAEAA